MDELVFEQIDTTDSQDKDSMSPVGILREGYMQVDLNTDKFVRNLKGRKRRYCVIKRNAQGQISVELMKTQDSSVNKVYFVIKSAFLRTSNKQRTTILQLIPVDGIGQPPEQCLLFPSESEPDIKPWFYTVDHALKNFPSEGEKTPEPTLSEAINETLSIVAAG